MLALLDYPVAVSAQTAQYARQSCACSLTLSLRVPRAAPLAHQPVGRKHQRQSGQRGECGRPEREHDEGVMS